MADVDNVVASVRSGLETGFVVNDERVVFEGGDESGFTVIEADVSMAGRPEARESSADVDEASAADEHMPILFAQVKGGMPGVVCVAVRDGKLLLARHWRFATDSYEWEFPRSMGMKGMTAGAVAEEELLRETGLRASSRRILQSVHADSCKLRDSIAVVELAVDGQPVDGGVGASGAGAIDADGGRIPAESRDSRLVWLSEEEIAEMIAAGDIMDCITLAAYLIWRTRRSAE
ncbi:NUDIX hydrolase [Bifidobacterium simiarum]|uniref:Nudix hydrolase domain-containing protein n=1 Tax=Bifidobacterium simiarum TaxID=2045441 RepID=A0A2M9HDE3_9BIFI|nr:hypothetical protein [Bifidobacterium simiarum]MBT1167168.1 hypothetical protein [Bifidobacterium simiarum]PJM74839.1 hypothetical protein CSQ87_07795 [Bifidobacterium simiarum]